MSKHWYTNGTDEGMFVEGTQPRGWSSGRSKIIINKISQTETGKTVDPEVVKRVAEKHKGKPSGMKGKHQSEEAKAKISKAGKGKIVSEETRRKISLAHKGKQTSENQRKLSSEAHMGQTPWNKGLKGIYHPTEETRKKQSEALKGQKRSEEFCLKMKELSNSPETKLKIYKSKKQNNSFNSSSYEENFYSNLLTIFENSDVVRQYKDERYPFACDFYIKPLDLFIELNICWTHGKMPFDNNNPECLTKLNHWKQKSISSKFYQNAIETWTIRDIEKLNILKENNLNYKIAYTQEDIENILNYLSKF